MSEVPPTSPGPGTVTPDPLPGCPAFVFWEPETGGLRVAALTLLDRLVVALHRGGAGPITVVGLPAKAVAPDALRRTKALRIPIRFEPGVPTWSGPGLVAATGVLVQPVDVRSLVRQGGRLRTRDGELLPIGRVNAVTSSWETALASTTPRSAAGVACRVTDAAGAREAARTLWASLTSSTDGWVDRWFNRPCGRPLSKLLAHTWVTPNAVSLSSVALGLAAGWGFGLGTPGAALVAALLFQLSAVIDCVDGDLARVVFKETKSGKWIDLVGDQVVHAGVFAGIAVGLVRGGQSPIAGWLGLSAVAGALVSFLVVLRGMLRPPAEGGQRLQRLIDAATNRDFSVLVLGLAVAQRLEWFLWMAAIGSHLFWAVALWLQHGARRSGEGATP